MPQLEFPKISRQYVVFSVLIMTMLVLYGCLGVISYGRESFVVDQLENFSQVRVNATFLVLSLLILAYGFLAMAQLKEWIPSRLSLRTILWCVSPLLILLVAIPPFMSLDTIAYVMPAKNFLLTEANPYTTALNGVEQNKWNAGLVPAWWLALPSIYGPLFSVLMIAVVFFQLQHIIFAITLYKLLAVGFFLGSIVLFDQIAAYFCGNRVATLLYAFNPAILVQGIMEGHNDILILFFVLLSIKLLLSEQNSWSALSLGAAAAIKYIPGLFVPIYWFRNQRFYWKSAVVSTVITIVPFLVFSWVFSFPLNSIFRNFFLQSHNTTCFYGVCSPVATFISWLFPAHAVLARDIISGLLVIGIGILFLIRCTRPTRIIEYMFWVLMVLFFIQAAWLAPWYLITPIALGFLLYRAHPIYEMSAYGLTFYSLLRYFGY